MPDRPRLRRSVLLFLILPVAITTASHTRSMPADEPDEGFPAAGILPKQETGALRFLKEHPEYDGRGIVVAIFDTGVDPGVEGLQTTSDGRPKVIDMIDGTGSGDVDTTEVRKATGGSLEGLTGRNLKVDPRWKNPSGEFRVGIKRAWDFFPSDLIAKLKAERREPFQKAHSGHEEALRLKIIEWDAKHPSTNDEQKRIRDDLNKQLEQLKQAGKNHDDPGPLYDCVLFHDGARWQAVVDTDEDSDLTDETVLSNFRDTRLYGTFGADSFLNFAVNIYDNGDRLSIVADTGAHGTHVAGIVAAHFPDQPELNGIAPGAQIVSVKIGDSRIDGMETGAGLVRGLEAVVRNKCSLINMSYGEPTMTPNRGRLVELFSDLVNKHGVIFVCSAGNAGPALSTVGAPGGTTTATIGVGAYVSPQMMKVEYSLREHNPGMPYSWTSRGPTTDGDFGVDIFAPGGAIAPVPRWTRQRNLRMNGTSMASPNTCGNIALLLSGLDAEQIPYSPWSIRRAMQNTAEPISTDGDNGHLDHAERFAQGPGLLQVDRAFAALTRDANAKGERLQYDVNIPARENARGIYLRDSFETNAPFQASISAKPVLPEGVDRDALTGFEQRLILRATADWVDVGTHLLLNHGGGSFEVRVDPTQLEPGRAHFAEVIALDSDNPDRGPRFRLPITVVKPTPSVEDREQMLFRAGTIHRNFLDVPSGATWADIRIQRLDPSGPDVRYILHALQLKDGERFRAANTREFFTLSPDETHMLSIPVTPGRTLEATLTQYWSSTGESTASIDVDFHGLRPDRDSVTLSTSEPIARVGVSAPLGLEQLAPSAKLTTRRTTLFPTTSTLRPLNDDRDRLPGGKLAYELVLSYEFDQPEPGNVTPRFPWNDDLLYESPFGTQLWMLFDSAKRRVMTDDIWPDPVSIGKGRHTLKLQLRHTNAELLESFKQAPVHIDRPLGSTLSLSCYHNRPDAVQKARAIRTATVRAGRRLAVYVAAPSADRIPKAASSGDMLLGTISWGAEDDSQAGAGKRPGGYPLTYLVQRPAKSSSEGGGSEAIKTADDLRMAQLRDVDFEDNRKRFDALAVRILKQKPDNLDVLQLKLHRLDTLEHRKQRLDEVVAAADDLISRIDQDDLAQEYGVRLNPDDKAASKRRKQTDRRREILVDALYRKGRALGYMELPDVIAQHPIVDRKAHSADFEANFAELRKWVDTTGDKYFLLHVRRERRQGRFGNALELLNKHIGKSAPNFWHFKKRRDLYEELGWSHLQGDENRWLTIRFPKRMEAF